MQLQRRSEKYADAIGCELIEDWEFLDNGKVKLILKEGWKDGRTDDN